MKRLFAAAVLVAALPLRGQDGAAILARVDQYRSPLESFSVDVDLTAYTPDNRSESSKFRVYGKGTDKSIVEFVAPATEKGKFLLMLRDVMWIYIPSASKPIRISPLQRLMGQASNGDVARTSFSVDYNAAAATEEEWEGRRAWVLELAAKDPAVAYARVKLWVDRKTHEPLRADFYVVSGKLVKRAFYRDFSVMSGRRVVSGIEIDDLLRPGNRTIMHYANLVARDNPDKMFTKDSLGKW
jgi:outer membrane lipoprotein-sorting protein